ncbi:GNAT family N-acetyltransferase [Massilia sp. YIM B02763]|uniref:GNAT family N-acetyltransferase n=1 Tax=Massilia sp. YIM B02763 TaxID=3050130 RepID=UPI0025B68619|nr:GNAT family N-acetyltransferase [Massilia sp. YIM B02763]MDN4053289.1 GNAT family N-acetyltransferase [Massilia sp. YIM B02763]
MKGHPTIRTLGADEAIVRIGELARVLVDCVEDGASVSFMLPMGPDKAERFWRGVAAGVARGERTLIVAEVDERIAGTVQLVTDLPENQPHRGEVAKLLVHPSARRLGLGRLLMQAVEEAARTQGRSVLVLDTSNAAAERLYEGLGWQRVGSVPDFARLPDGPLCATTFFYKRVERVAADVAEFA